jgi:hypothetical protein
MASNTQFSSKFVKKLQGRVETQYKVKADAEEAQKKVDYRTKKISYGGLCCLANSLEDLNFEYLLTEFNQQRLREALKNGFPPKVVGWKFDRKGTDVWGELELKGKEEVMAFEVRLQVPTKATKAEIIDIEWPWPHNEKE